MAATGSLVPSLAPQVAIENSRGAAVRRALCDSARGAAVFVYCVRAFVSVLCVCLAARRIGRRRALAITALRVCSDRAQVARATSAVRHSWRCDGHVLTRVIAGASRAARLACSAYGGVVEVLARRGPRAAIYIRVVRLARQ